MYCSSLLSILLPMLLWCAGTEQNSNGPSLAEIHIPQGHAIVTDGKVSSGEWDDAASAQIEVQPDWKIPVRFKHDDKNLYFLFEDVRHGTERLYPEIFLDPKNSKSVAWEKSQWWFHVSYNLCEGNGEANVYRKNGTFQCARQKDGWEANNPPNSQYVEVRVSFSKLGTDPAPGLRMGLALAVTNATGDNRQKWFFWPPTAKVNAPFTWGEAIL
jgi:hypothetical protein